MPHITADISAEGAIIDFLAGVSAAHARVFHSKKQPSPVKLRGIIDTGASITCIHMGSISSFHLRVTGTVQIMTPSTGASHHVCDQSDISLILQHPNGNVELATLPIIMTDLSCLEKLGIHALVGRDGLAKCLLFYNGAVKRFALAF